MVTLCSRAPRISFTNVTASEHDFSCTSTPDRLHSFIHHGDSAWRGYYNYQKHFHASRSAFHSSGHTSTNRTRKHAKNYQNENVYFCILYEIGPMYECAIDFLSVNMVAALAFQNQFNFNKIRQIQWAIISRIAVNAMKFLQRLPMCIGIFWHAQFVRLFSCVLISVCSKLWLRLSRSRNQFHQFIHFTKSIEHGVCL